MEKETERISKLLAIVERQIQESKASGNNAALDILRKKEARLKDELKGTKMSTNMLAKNLLLQRKNIKALSKIDFNDLIRRLSKRPEYAFLKSMPKTTIKNDIERPAKPVGWRFKGRGNYDKPTARQIVSGKKSGAVYNEKRPLRSDVSQVVKLKEGGKIKTKKGDIGKSGTQYGYTLKEWEDNAQKIGLLVSPTQYWKNEEGKKYTDNFGRSKTLGQHSSDKDQEMIAYAYRIAIGLDLGSNKIPASAKKYVQDNNLAKYANGGNMKKPAIKTVLEVLYDTDNWGPDMQNQAYKKGNNLIYLDSFYYGEEKALKNLISEWSKDGHFYDYFMKEYSIEPTIISSFSEIKATGKHKKFTDNGIVGVELSFKNIEKMEYGGTSNNDDEFFAYWNNYNDGYGPGAGKNFDLDDAIEDAVEDWNNENELGSENEVSEQDKKDLKIFAKRFFDMEDWISENVLQAMIASQEYTLAKQKVTKAPKTSTPVTTWNKNDLQSWNKYLFKITDFPINSLIEFENGEIWKVVKPNNSIKPNEISIKPYNKVAKDKYISLAIDVSISFLNKTVKYITREGGYFRIDEKLIGNELYIVKQSINSLYDSLNSGNDIDPNVLDGIIEKLNFIKSNIKQYFSNGGNIGQTIEFIDWKGNVRNGTITEKLKRGYEVMTPDGIALVEESEILKDGGYINKSSVIGNYKEDEIVGSYYELEGDNLDKMFSAIRFLQSEDGQEELEKELKTKSSVDFKSFKPFAHPKGRGLFSVPVDFSPKFRSNKFAEDIIEAANKVLVDNGYSKKIKFLK
jgi:hypothetical protein